LVIYIFFYLGCVVAATITW